MKTTAKKLDLSNEGFIQLPSGLLVAKERTFLGKDWFDSHRLLQTQGNRMLTILEFIEFLNYTKQNHPDIYSRIVSSEHSQDAAEWIDSFSRISDEGVLNICSQHYIEIDPHVYGRSPKISQPLDNQTLILNRGISLDVWLRDHTNQGLPKKDIEDGELLYENPIINHGLLRGHYSPPTENYFEIYVPSSNFRAALFSRKNGKITLSHRHNPNDTNNTIGVRAARQIE